MSTQEGKNEKTDDSTVSEVELPRSEAHTLLLGDAVHGTTDLRSAEVDGTPEVNIVLDLALVEDMVYLSIDADSARKLAAGLERRAECAEALAGEVDT